jgi:hypothetical protein
VRRAISQELPSEPPSNALSCRVEGGYARPTLPRPVRSGVISGLGWTLVDDYP